MSTPLSLASGESDQGQFSLNDWVSSKAQCLTELAELGIEGISKVGTGIHIVWGYGGGSVLDSAFRDAMFAAQKIRVLDTAYHYSPDMWAELIVGAHYEKLVSTLKAVQHMVEFAYDDAHEFDVAVDPDYDE